MDCEAIHWLPARGEAHRNVCVRVPIRSAVRSWNLSKSAAIVVYEAGRQLGAKFNG